MEASVQHNADISRARDDTRLVLSFDIMFKIVWVVVKTQMKYLHLNKHTPAKIIAYENSWEKNKLHIVASDFN